MLDNFLLVVYIFGYLIWCPLVGSLLYRGEALSSLRQGKWVKFICGASNEDLAAIRNLCYIYTLAGVDCIDMAPVGAVVLAARSGVDAALNHQLHPRRPLLMVSLNDAEDNHFRKAQFDPLRCPSDCRRPCEVVCPAWAINRRGVDQQKCYGCGRCIPACPLHLIAMNNHVVDGKEVIELIRLGLVDAIEIHTNLQQKDSFLSMWSRLHDVAIEADLTVSISFNDCGDRTIDLIHALDDAAHRSVGRWPQGFAIWQADGRSMSGDLGHPATSRSAIQLAKDLLGPARSQLFGEGRGYLQLAGGTNNHSYPAARREGLVHQGGFGGFAFGGFARKAIVQHLIQNAIELENIEDNPDALNFCLKFANGLVRPIKS